MIKRLHPFFHHNLNIGYNLTNSYSNINSNYYWQENK